MDADIVLNLAVDDQTFSGNVAGGKKGGRWKDRLKAKRVAKRKISARDRPAPSAPNEANPSSRPAKRLRLTEPDHAPPPQRSQTQFISSLFTSNPKVEAPAPSAGSKTALKPSNAPLGDASSFLGLGLNSLITAHLTTKMHIHTPTSIQKAALPALLATSARDVFIQSQTGSGKTLSFLLPIIQDLLPLSSLSYIDRSIGTLAVVIAPTRELAKQISDVLEALLKLRLRPEEERSDEPSTATRLTRWLVSGLITGGGTRTHEKARLRKGVPILVSTPGRLLDHLQNTASFDIGKCRWLVLDEADRLMELGFEETLTGIIKGLDGRRRLAMQATQEGNSTATTSWDWERRRRTVLCSATIREDVQKLAGTALVNPLMIKATETDPQPNNLPLGAAPPPAPEQFTPPSQLSQKYVVVPLKQRLVALIALLRSLLAQSQGRRGSKIIVFLSCTDSVDFHWRLLGGCSMGADVAHSDDASNEDSDENAEDCDDSNDKPRPAPADEGVEAKSSLLPNASIFRLHGSLPTATRLASLRKFVSASNPPPDASKLTPAQSAILLCTSVASRGLDLPFVRAVIQYDLPTEGGATEYVHRVGRTARAGKGGEAWSIVAPSEAEWVKWVEGKMRGDGQNEKDEFEDNRNIRLDGVMIESVLKNGFGGKGNEYEERATDVQLAFERWVLRRKEHAELARRAFLSHMRAYATHPSAEKHIFHIRHLHIGHLAKAFALRDAPKAVTGGASTKHGSDKGKRKHPEKGMRVMKRDVKNAQGRHGGDAERRMQEVVRSQGRLLKKEGVMRSTGASEFQVASGATLEKLVNRA